MHLMMEETKPSSEVLFLCFHTQNSQQGCALHSQRGGLPNLTLNKRLLSVNPNRTVSKRQRLNLNSNRFSSLNF